jgi:hypothetical protein
MTNSVSHILAYNIAMHLSRGHKDIFFAVHTLRPGDGQRSKDCPEGRVGYETLESNPNPNANQES